MGRTMRTALLMLASATAFVVPATAFAGSKEPLPPPAPTVTFGGRAVAVEGMLGGTPVALADTGSVGAEGGSLEAELLCYPVSPTCASGLPDNADGALQAEAMRSSVVAQGTRSEAASSTSFLLLSTFEGWRVYSPFLGASAGAECVNGVASATGSSTIAEVYIDGQLQAITGAANQRVTLPGSDGGYIVFNEQTTAGDGEAAEIVVTAAHIVLPGIPFADASGFLLPPMDLRVGTARAAIRCAPATAACTKAKITGGGWFDVNAERVHFAFATRDGADTWGHLLYEHKALGLKVKGNPSSSTLTFTSGSHNDGNAVSQGPAEAMKRIGNKDVKWYEVVAYDGGEPGRPDRFSIVLLTAPRASGGVVLYSANVGTAIEAGPLSLLGGNLQFHPCKGAV
jgi:hypothetical protein